MGSSLRKPVAVNNWESLSSEAIRLENSAKDIVYKAKLGTSGLKSRMSIVKSQSLMIRLMLFTQVKNIESRKEFCHDWWNRMDSLFTEFQIYLTQSLITIHELEEPLLT